MVRGYSQPYGKFQQLGFNVGLNSSAEFTRILNDTGPVQSFYIALGANGTISTETGLPSSGDTKLRVQLRGGIKYPLGDYTVAWTGTGTIGGQNSPLSFTVSGPTDELNYNIQGELLTFSITPNAQPPTLTYSPSFDARARYGDCFRFMESWRINEDGGAGGAAYDTAHPYVRIRTVPGANTFYHQLLRPSMLGAIGKAYGKDLWICVHHRASDQNITDAINGILSSGFDGTIYFEYSNEAWNSSFPQWQYMLDEANASGNYSAAPGDTAKVAAYHADRTHQTSGVAKAAYAGVVGVWGAWTAVPNTYNNVQQFGMYAPFANIDACAISFYFGGPESRALTEQEALDLDAQGAADLCRTDWTGRVIPLIQQWLAHNADWGVRTVGYEGGSHLDRSPEDEASAHLAQLSQSPEVGEVHGEVFDWWDQNVGDLANFFQDSGNPDDPWSWLSGELGATSPRLQEFYDRARR
jgi:hypothetical protein